MPSIERWLRASRRGCRRPNRRLAQSPKNELRLVRAASIAGYGCYVSVGGYRAAIARVVGGKRSRWRGLAAKSFLRALNRNTACRPGRETRPAWAPLGTTVVDRNLGNEMPRHEALMGAGGSSEQ